jgi:DNA polymerase-3 subunit alpha
MSFIHLHVHTQFSIADATTRVGDMVEFASREGMWSIAMTDHDNLHGAIEFTETCRKKGIKPIYGCCLSIANRPVGEHVKRVHHLTLLAADQKGWQNLVFLVSMAHLKAPPSGHPRIDPELLAAHAEGLIGLSGDLSGEIANALLRNEPDEAKRHALKYKKCFGEGNFYIEVQHSGLAEHELVAPQLIALAKEVGLPCVATNDVHYLKREEARAHEVLMCIGLGIQARQEDEELPTDQLDLATATEMRRRFEGHEALCDATTEIAQRCNVNLDLGDPVLPRFPVPDGTDETTYFAALARKGLEVRLAEHDAVGFVYDRSVYEARLEREIGVITDMDFPGYFLIVQDFINWAKENGIPVGPGRGSGAGSLVAWSMRITNLDPLPYKLLFERFLNPGRKSLPDFDIDFCVDRRGEVIKYVAQRYGEDRVGQIATFGTLKAKGAIRDVGRVLGVPLSDVNEVAKLVPDTAKNLDEALVQEPRLKERADNDPVIGRLVKTATLLEGALRNVGMHAAGVVIARGPLWEQVPVGKGQAGENVTQFDKDDVEKAGLVKFDFLGLKNLTMIQHAVNLVRQSQLPEETPFDIDKIPLDNPKAYEVMSRGDTAGVFQMESSGFTGMVKGLQPSEFEDIVAAGALYRPGPLGMGMHTRYIERKHKREPVEYPHALLAEVLEETYGVIVYQEQVMQVAQILAGFSLSDADNLRRAMGKKKADEMAKWGEKFVAGAVERGVETKTADDIFELMRSFAEYGFNKSHAAAYGLVTYQTAYLKGLYPKEFFAALLTSDQGDTDKVVQYIQQARGTGISVLPPDINESALSFSVTPAGIRFGLGAIKGLGESAIEALLGARGEAGKFASIFDFCRRVDTRKVNKRTIEALVKCGAMDSFGQSRDMLWANIGRAVERAQEEVRERESAQTSLFGMLEAKGAKPVDSYVTPNETWPMRQMLAFEKEILGFYVSGHPLDRYARDLHRLSCKTLASLKDPDILQTATMGARGPRRLQHYAAVVVVAHREQMTQKGTRMGFTTVEDLSGQAEIVVFAKALEQAESLLQGSAPLLMKLSVDADGREEGKVRLALEEVVSLDDAMRSKLERMRIFLREDQCEHAKLKELTTLLATHPGTARVTVLLRLAGRGEVVVAAGSNLRVALSDELIGKVEKLLGRETADYG